MRIRTYIKMIKGIGTRSPHILHVDSGEEKKMIQDGLLWMPPDALAFGNRTLENHFKGMIRDESMKSKIPVVAGSENAVRAGGTEIIAVDNSEAMVARCRKRVSNTNRSVPIDVRLQNMLDTRIENASVVVLNFTLQFLDRGQRQTLIDRIAAGLRTGGVLIISEKICFEDEQEQADQTAWHHDFKRSQGYSELEIAQKRNALEDVLRPETEAAHFKRLEQAGLSNPRRWFQCFSFASYIAFK